MSFTQIDPNKAMATLYKNAKIVTLDKNDKLRPIQSWMLVNHDKIIEIGTDSDPVFCKMFISKIVDLKSKWVFPGLHDCHLHVGHLGEQLNTLSMKGCKGKQEFISRIENYIVSKLKIEEKLPEKPDLLLIKALDWEQDVLGFLPDRFILDEICSKFPERKIVMKLPRVCHHIHLYNTLALELNQIDTTNKAGSYAEKFNTNPSLGGEVDVDENGVLTGIFRENAGSDGFHDFFMGLRLDEQVRKEVMDGIGFCLKKGVTCVHTCEVGYWNVWQQIYRTEKKIPRCQITHFTNYSAFEDKIMKFT